MPRHEFTSSEAAAAGRRSGMVRQRKAEERRARLEPASGEADGASRALMVTAGEEQPSRLPEGRPHEMPYRPNSSELAQEAFERAGLDW